MKWQVLRFVSFFVSSGKHFVNSVSSLVKNFRNISGIKFFSTNCITLMRPWYHQFSTLGIQTPQFVSGNYRSNQLRKDEFVIPMIREAMEKLSNESSRSLHIVDLFAADSYYGFHALTMHENSTLTAVDLLQNSGEGAKRTYVSEQAILISKLLGKENKFRFLEMSVFDFIENADFIINTGGLYHIENPELLLSQLNNICRGIMVLQTVTHEDKNAKSFFETPAPNWTWGSRFSVRYLHETLKRTGWEILDERFSVLNGNTDPKDRGSIFMICRPNSKS